MAVAGGLRLVVVGNGFGEYEIPQGAMMKIRNSKSETRNKFEIRILTYPGWAFTRKFVTQLGQFDLKAVGFQLPVFSAFEFRNSDLLRISSFELRIYS